MDYEEKLKPGGLTRFGSQSRFCLLRRFCKGSTLQHAGGWHGFRGHRLGRTQRTLAGAGGFLEHQTVALSNFLNARGDNRSLILGMAKLQMHASSDVAEFQHRSS